MIGAAVAGAIVGVLVLRYAIGSTLAPVSRVSHPSSSRAMFLFFSRSPPSSSATRGAPVAKAAVGTDRAAVVMIVLDEFPEASLLDGTGHIDAPLFPHFAASPQSSTWYRNDSTVARTPAGGPGDPDRRQPVHPDELPISRRYPQSLFTLLGRRTHERARERHAPLCPSSICSDVNGHELADHSVRCTDDSSEALAHASRRPSADAAAKLVVRP